jgi:transcriptional regulator with XRE-family HTH domain
MRAGEFLRERRRDHGVTQAELALRAGTRQSTISRIERGHEEPTVERLAQLLLVLGEELQLGAVPLDPRRPASDIAADRRRTPGERLEDGFALAAFASQLAGAARR